MKCNVCSTDLSDGSRFCNRCGVEQKQGIQKLYQNAFGLWSVSTEGDCEGRSTKQLGVHEGYVDEIAAALASQVEYKLTFKAVNSTSLQYFGQPKKVRSVYVSFDIEAGTWSMSPVERVNHASRMLKDRPVKVRSGTYHASVELVFDE